MEDYPHQLAEEQPTHPRQPSLSPQPVRLVHQQQPQQALEVHLQQGLVAVQDLERQRLKSLQDLGASQPR